MISPIIRIVFGTGLFLVGLVLLFIALKIFLKSRRKK